MEIAERDVIVVGAGNAATCAALSAAENGASVLMLEIAPQDAACGNSAFTGGAFRVVYHGFDDLAQLIPDMGDHDRSNVDVGTYTAEQYYDDVGRLTEWRCDPDLTEILITQSFETGKWMRAKGVRFQLGLGRQAFKVDGKFKFWGGLACHIWGGGKELMKALHATREREQIPVYYQTPALALLQGDNGVEGVRVRHQGRIVDVRSKAVILACGGFEANAEMRARYLGPNWDLAKVRGTKYNTGQGLKMALDIGAAPAGHWSGCHAVQWDLNAPPVGDLDVGDRFQKHGYPFGIVVNARGQRFIDEGARFPLLHLRQIRPRGDEPAGSVRLAGVRPEDPASVARRIPHRALHQGKGRHLGRAGRQDGRRRPQGLPRDDPRVQRRAAPGRDVQPQRP